MISEYRRHAKSTQLTCRKRVDGKFLGPGGSSVPEGQELLSGLLDSAFEMSQDIKGRDAQDDVSPSIKPIYDRLSEMKSQLDQLCKLARLARGHKLIHSRHASMDSTRNGSLQVSLVQGMGSQRLMSAMQCR